MLNPKLTEYVERVLDMGFSQNKIKEVMVKRGYKAKEAENIIKEVMRNRKKGKHLFDKKIIDISHDEFLKKVDKKIISYVEKELERDYSSEQIEALLVEEGYDKKIASKAIKILEHRKKKHDLLHKLTEEIEHLKDIEYHFVPDRKWIKDLSIVGLLLIIFSVMIYYKNSALSSLIIKAIAFLVTIPLITLILYRTSIKIKEKTYRDALMLIGFVGVIIFLVDLFAPFFAVLISLPLLFYLFMHLVEKNYELERKKALKMSLTTFLSGAVSIYLILVIIGFIIGLFGVLTT